MATARKTVKATRTRKTKKPVAARRRNKAANEDIRKELHDEWEAISNTIKKAANRVKDGSLHSGGDMLRQTKETMESNPLKTLGIAAGIGLVIGMLLKK